MRGSALFKKSIDIITNSIIELGQALLKLDGIGVDALFIGFVVFWLIETRAKIYE